jgi:NAD-dependent dihydropyrimidine dehydrogenase PreA subunit
MQVKLDAFSQAILARREVDERDTDATYALPGWGKVFDVFVPRSWNYGLHKYMYQRLIEFYSDANCKGCGICEQVCLSHKIALSNGMPTWHSEVKCYACFACINFCPQRAIQVRSRFPVKSYTEVNARYHHPDVTYRDIAGQK